MSNNVPISGISSGENVKFQLSGFFTRRFRTPIFSFIAPKFPKRIDKVDKTKASVAWIEVKETISEQNITYSFNYFKVTAISKKNAQVLLAMTDYATGTTEIATDITKGSVVEFYTNKNKITPFNTGTYSNTNIKVPKTESGNVPPTGDIKNSNHVVYIQVPKGTNIKLNSEGGVTAADRTNNRLVLKKLTKSVSKRALVKITDPEVTDNLMSTEKVFDILLFAYSTNNNLEKYLVSEIGKQGTKTDLTFPPEYNNPSVINKYYDSSNNLPFFQYQNSGLNEYFTLFGTPITFYAAIVRYIYKEVNGQNVWTKDWLQKDESGQPIWLNLGVKQ